MGLDKTIPCVNCTRPAVCLDNGACIFDFVMNVLPDNFDEEVDDGFCLLSESPGDEIVKEY